jgi:hypothetical protein
LGTFGCGIKIRKKNAKVARKLADKEECLPDSIAVKSIVFAWGNILVSRKPDAPQQESGPSGDHGGKQPARQQDKRKEYLQRNPGCKSGMQDLRKHGDWRWQWTDWKRFAISQHKPAAGSWFFLPISMHRSSCNRR